MSRSMVQYLAAPSLESKVCCNRSDNDRPSTSCNVLRPALARFAASGCRLNPCGAHAVACFSRGDVGSNGDDRSDRLVTEYSGKLSWNMPECFVYAV
jgi:hypothetical protein